MNKELDEGLRLLKQAEGNAMSEEEFLASITAMADHEETRNRLEQQMREQMPWLAQKIRDDMEKEQEQ